MHMQAFWLSNKRHSGDGRMKASNCCERILHQPRAAGWQPVAPRCGGHGAPPHAGSSRKGWHRAWLALRRPRLSSFFRHSSLTARSQPEAGGRARGAGGVGGGPG